MAINKIKLGSKIYDTWSTRDDVESVKSEVSSKLGSSQDTGVSNTIFGSLRSIKDHLISLVDGMSSVPYAKESTSQEILNEVQNIDIDTTELAKENTLNAVHSKLDNLNVEVDLSEVAKEDTLNQGVGDIIKAVENIDFTDLENSIAEVKNAVENIDLTSIESKVEAESQAIQSAIQNIDLSSVENKVEEVKQAVDDIDLTPIENKVQEGVNTLSSKIDNIDLSAVENKVQEESAAIQEKIDNITLPEIDTTELAKESTLQEVSSKLDNVSVEVDLSAIAKQGENAEATNSAIYDAVKAIPELKNMYSAHFEPNEDGEDTYTMVLPLSAVVDGNTLII